MYSNNSYVNSKKLLYYFQRHNTSFSIKQLHVNFICLLRNQH